MKIEIDGLTEAQELALTDLLTTWGNLGKQGASRWTAFFADGDGNFHPDIKVNDKEVEFSKYYSQNKYIGQQFAFGHSPDFQDTGLFFDYDVYAGMIREEEKEL